MTKFNKSLAVLALVLGCGNVLANYDGYDYYPPFVEQNTKYFIEFGAGTNAYYLGVWTSGEDAKTLQAGAGGFGWGVDIGYAFTKYVALEAGFIQNYLTVRHNDDDDYGDEQKYSDLYHLNVPYAAARFTIPVARQFELIAKLGLMLPNGSIKEYDDVDDEIEHVAILLPFVGLGLGYKLTPEIETTVQYQGAVYGIVGAGLLSANIAYHF